jgi:hypothetical protein
MPPQSWWVLMKADSAASRLGDFRIESRLTGKKKPEVHHDAEWGHDLEGSATSEEPNKEYISVKEGPDDEFDELVKKEEGTNMDSLISYFENRLNLRFRHRQAWVRCYYFFLPPRTRCFLRRL